MSIYRVSIQTRDSSGYTLDADHIQIAQTDGFASCCIHLPEKPGERTLVVDLAHGEVVAVAIEAMGPEEKGRG